MDDAIVFDNVNAGYRDRAAIEGISLSIAEGEMVALIGPNGAGKTTLMRTATGLIRPMSGSVRLWGQDVRTLPATTRARLVGVVPQQIEVPVAFPVSDLVMIGRTASLSRWSPPSAEDRLAVERAMVYADIAHLKDRPFPDLSAGERQRAAIAMVLAQQPKAIFMDEPTAHLDINHRLEIMQIVERLNTEQNVTVIMISHDLNLAAEFCRRLILMDRGRVVGDGTPEGVLTEGDLRRIYGCDIRVRRDPVNGSVTVVPAPRLAPVHSGRGVRVHVIAGGGCASEVLRFLHVCDYSVTCGALNEGDSDTEVAGALGIPTATEKPFSPIGPPVMEKAHSMSDGADILILCNVPFGPGNLANLDLASRAMDRGKSVLIMAGIENRDYTPGRVAEKKVRDLLERGARQWNDMSDLMRMLERPVTGSTGSHVTAGSR